MPPLVENKSSESPTFYPTPCPLPHFPLATQAPPNQKSNSLSEHAPECSTLCLGSLPPAVGSARAVVCSLLGYCVMWPLTLTEATSAARIKPYLPPWITASSFEQGSVTCACPELKRTYLCGFGGKMLAEGHWLFWKWQFEGSAKGKENDGGAEREEQK